MLNNRTAQSNVRPNRVSPFAWIGMTESIPAMTEAQRARIERAKTMSPDKIAPMVAVLLSGAAKDVTAKSWACGRTSYFVQLTALDSLYASR